MITELRGRNFHDIASDYRKLVFIKANATFIWKFWDIFFSTLFAHRSTLFIKKLGEAISK